jgi:hypothetical protein
MTGNTYKHDFKNTFSKFLLLDTFDPYQTPKIL